MARWILASASPRRKALLEALGLVIEVRPTAAEELTEGAPRELVLENARRKRDAAVRDNGDGAVIIAADTVVVHGGRVLGKPGGLDEARQMLAGLSGETHEVHTGVAVLDTGAGRSAEGHEVTGVTFRRLSPAMIEAFIAAVRPLDRAGAYTVDGPGSLLVERYEGCYQNVLGLPMARLDRVLETLDLSLFRHVDPGRAAFL